MQLILEPHGQKLELLSLQYSFWLFDRIQRRVEHVWDYVNEVRMTEEPFGARTCIVILENPKNEHEEVTVGPIQLAPRRQPDSPDTFNAMVEIMGYADEAAVEIGNAILREIST